MKFSVVMPVYNAGGFLRAAISSILAQEFRDFELLLIDDGATDGSAAVCDEFAACDGRVRVFHRENGGICRARNFGIEKASGQYVMFSDHDDEYLPGYLSVVADAIAETGGSEDVVKVNFSLADRWPDRRSVLTHPGWEEPSCKWSRGSEYGLFERLTLAVWDGAYKREFLLRNRLAFDEAFKFGCEGFAFMLQCLARTEKVYWRSEVCYRHYNNHGVSTSGKYYERRINDIIRVACLEAELFGPTTLKRSLERFRRWNGALVLSALQIPGAPRSVSRKIAAMYRMQRAILPRPPTACTTEDGLSPSEKTFLLIFRFRLFWLYCLMTLWKCRSQPKLPS